MGNGARAHNHFCAMPEVDPCFGSVGNVITNIHSSPLHWTQIPVLSINAYCASALCISPRA